MSDLYKPLAIASTTALGLTLMLAAPSVFKPIPAVLATLAGLGLTASGAGLATKEELEFSAYSGSLSLLGDGFNELLSADEVAKTIKQLPLHRLPSPLRDPLLAFAEVAVQNKEWRQHFREASSLVAGVKNSGKTVYLQLDAFEFLEETQGNGYLRISDVNYGKRDNFWGGLPVASPNRDQRTGQETIFTELDDIPLLIDEFWQEKERRRELTISGEQTDFEPWKLIVDELNRSLDRLKDRMKKEAFASIWVQIKDLLFEAHGYKIFFTGGCQTLAVGELQMTQAMQKQMNAVLLGSTAIDPDEVSRVAARGQTDELIQQVKKLREIPGCKYACIVKLDGQETRVEVVPPIDLEQYQIILPGPTLSPAEEWAIAQQEFAVAVANGELTKSAFWKEHGQGRQSTENEFYQAFLKQIEAVQVLEEV